MTAFKTVDMKERVRRLATGENTADGALRKTVAPHGTAIDNLVDKDDLGDYFDNIAVAATPDKVVKLQARGRSDNPHKNFGPILRRRNKNIYAGQGKPQDLPSFPKRVISKS